MVDADLIAAHGMFDGFVGRKVNSVGRTYASTELVTTDNKKKRNKKEKKELGQNRKHGGNIPAPTITLDMPRHKLKTPSVRAIWKAFRRTLLCVIVPCGCSTCIRVYRRKVPRQY